VNLKAKLQPFAPPVLSIARIVAGLIFMEHGTQKLLGFPPGAHSGAAFMTMIWWSGVIELIAGALITLGLFTRGAAFIASGMCAVAYWTVHAAKSPYPVNNGGDAAILFCFLFLYLVFAGPGPWSADAMRRR
jgi:putative oxidoreductase